MALTRSANSSPAKRRTYAGWISQASGWVALLLWAVILVYAASKNPSGDAHPGRWAGITFVEGNAVYLWFEDQETCLAAMGDDAASCVKSEAVWGSH